LFNSAADLPTFPPTLSERSCIASWKALACFAVSSLSAWIIWRWCWRFLPCEISSSHGGEYDVQNCLLGYTAV
jgi:hypothetical protein